MAQNAKVDILDAVSAPSISELDKDRQWPYSMSEALLHIVFLVRSRGQRGCNVLQPWTLQVCLSFASFLLLPFAFFGGVGGSGIAESLEVVAVATGGGGRSGSVFLGLDGLFGFGEGSC